MNTPNCHYRISKRACSILLLFLATVLSLTALGKDQASTQLIPGHIRALLPGTNNTAAYLTVHNHADKPIILTGVWSSAAKQVEIHENRHDNGHMQMRAVAQLEIPAGSSLSFAPGGYHIMLMGVTQALDPGDSIDITLCFSDDNHITINLPVKSVKDE